MSIVCVSTWVSVNLDDIAPNAMAEHLRELGYLVAQQDESQTPISDDGDTAMLAVSREDLDALYEAARDRRNAVPETLARAIRTLLDHTTGRILP